MRVLVAVATYPESSGSPDIYPETQAALDALLAPYEDALEPHPEGSRLLAELVYFGGDDPALSWLDNITDKHNLMRQMALDGGYDALLTVEADVVFPADALTRLLAVDADVVYGTYVSRAIEGLVLVFPEIDGYSARSITAEPDKWREPLAEGRVIRSEGAGFGCTLIRRNVLDTIIFRRDRKRKNFADDWPFALDVKEAGFHSAHHLGVLCGHLAHDGRVYWPDATAPKLVRVDGERRATGELRVYPDGNYLVLKRSILHAGLNRYFYAGETIPLTSGAATILAASGLIGPLPGQE